jgi:TrmH family RNA methyltransferase
MKTPERITSRANPRLNHARSVMRGDEPELIFVEGVRLVEEAIKSGIEIYEAFVTDSFLAANADSLIDGLSSLSCPVWEISQSLGESIADTKSPHGIFVIAARPHYSPADIEDPKLVVYLHEINNPVNLGAIIRTAEAAGASGVMVSAHSADPFSPKSLRGAMGSAFRLRIIEQVDPNETSKWATKSGLVNTAVDIKGPIPYTEADWSVPRLLIFGSEAHGLEAGLKNAVNEIITIPMENGVESLNLAVSCGVVLFEALRRRSL